MSEEPESRASRSETDEPLIDWEGLRLRFPSAADPLQRLEALESLTREQRNSAVGAGGTPERWGSLVLLESLGTGGFGEVYRAFDPALQREVALKLHRVDSASEGSRRWLDEARRLARVRHPNVLTVHGADERDGRAGIWTELLHGRTLEDGLGEHGPLSAREATLIGVELCRALAAVHSVGLVHGDVKAANVIREGTKASSATDSGRIVLLDFGAAHERTAEAASGTAGTPLVAAPEVLAGEPASAAADIYSLGVLLYRLVSGRYPVEAASIEELRSSRPPVSSLLDRRPDLPPAFVTIVERAMAVVPTDRFPSAGAMERALSSFLAGTEMGRRVWMARWAVGVVLLALLGAALYRVIDRPDGPSAPSPPKGTDALQPSVPDPARTNANDGSTGSASAQMKGVAGVNGPASTDIVVRAQLLRWRDGIRSALADGDSVRPGDLLMMEIHSAEPLYTYIVNEDSRGNLTVLFPLPGFEPRNPLPSDVVHRLPGERTGTALDWKVTSAGGRERFLIVGSRTALPALESRLSELPHSGGVLDAAGPRRRGVSGLAPDPGAPPSESGRLRELAQMVESGDNGKVWVRWIELVNPERSR